MRIRWWRWIASAAVSFLAVTGCRLVILTPQLSQHVQTRIGYGPSPFNQDRLRALGVDGYINEQLQPDTIDDAELEQKLAPLDTLNLPIAEIFVTYGPPAAPVSDEDFQKSARQLVSAKILRSTYSHRQLEAALTDFWFNHFNVNADGIILMYLTEYEREAIRPHVLGKFRDLLLAVAKSPAMLRYLDNDLNFIDGFEYDGKSRGLNENYAREIMELHTLGVDAGYTQQDVIEVARCFSGWTIDLDSLYVGEGDGFIYMDAGHDKGAKSIMGALNIPANGGFDDAVQVIDFLATNPNTAERLSRKLVQRFVNEDAPEVVVQAATQTWLATNGDLREVMRTILMSNAFIDAQHFGTKTKRPLVYVASLARGLGLDVENHLAELADLLSAMGEPLFQVGPPTGYPDKSAFWSNAGPALARLNAAHVYSLNGVLSNLDLTMDGSLAEIASSVAGTIYPGGLTPQSTDEILALLGTLNLGTNEERVRVTASAVLSAPELFFH